MVYLGLPFLKMVDLSMAMLNHQMVFFQKNPWFSHHCPIIKTQGFPMVFGAIIISE